MNGFSPSAAPIPGETEAAVTPVCRICRSSKRVAIYRTEAPGQAVCVECCDGSKHHDGETGHQFSYDRYDGHTCDYCGINRNDTAARYDDWVDE